VATLAQVKKTIAKRVRARRADLGLSQEQLAEVAVLDPRHIQKIEAAESNMTLETILKVAKALKMSGSDLIA
jgi:transcriptional regulator with XRE-family HTH domain